MTFKHKLSVRLALMRDALLLVPVTALLACEKPVQLAGPDPIVTRVAVSPKHITLDTRQTSQFMAVGLTATGDTANIALTWMVTGGSIADTFSNGRKHFAKYRPSTHPGRHLVVAADGPGGMADTGIVTVIPTPVASVALSPAVAGIFVGATLQLTAIPQDSSGSPLTERVVAWSSSAPTVASVGPSGLVSGLAAGSAIITAISEGKSGTSAFTVTNVPVASVTLAPAWASILVGTTQQLAAVTKDSAGNTLAGRVITWSSSNPSVVAVTVSGLVTGQAAGSATISATSEGKSGTSAITVTTVPVASVTVSPTSASVPVGATQQVSAVTKDSAGNPLSGRVVTWASSNTSVATVSASGLVTGQVAGSTTITATSEGKNGTSAITVTNVPVAAVTVSPTSASVPVGATQQLAAVTKDSAGNTLSGRVVTWESSNTSVASVSGTGLVTGQAAGSATITATSEGKSGTSAITVTSVPVASVTVSPTSAILLVGATEQLSAVTKDSAGNTLTGRVVTWSSSNTSVATVSASGLVTGHAAGGATITATSEGRSGTSGIFIQAPPSGSRVGYYVAPNGSPTGDGSAAQPWNLATALAGPAAVQPGDTIWLRGGRYSGIHLTSNLSGTAANPIIVRQYPGERAILDASRLLIQGSYTWYWGFEFMNSNLADAEWSGVDMRAPGTRLINLIVHDATGNGIGAWPTAPNAELYGNIVFNNGRGFAAHGIYFENTLGTKRVVDNVVFNGYAYNLHGYAANSALLNIHVEGNIAFNAGAWGSGGKNLHIGGLQPVQNLTCISNYTYGNGGNRFGYHWGPNSPSGSVIRDNYLYGNVIIADFLGLTFTNNTVVGATAQVISMWARDATDYPNYTFNNNTYLWKGTGADQFFLNVGAAGDGSGGVSTNYTFAGWRATTGFDQASTFHEAALTGTKVVVRPNRYEPGRAHVAVYNWDKTPSVNVDLTGVLSIGQAYEVREVQDLFGAPVLSGTYAGGTVAFPMTAVTPTPPLGPHGGGPSTGTEFHVFLLVPK